MMNTKRFSIIMLLQLFITVSTMLAQELISVYPQEYPKALKNPLKGFRPDPNFTPSASYPYPTIVRAYIKWNEIENDSTDGVQKIIDYCNLKWKDFDKKNIRVIPRVYIQWDRDDLKGNWPADLTAHDWSSPQFKDRVVKLIYKLGLAWDNDPRVAWVQTGIMGWWGEQENPVGVDEDGWAKRLGDAFDGAFKNKRFIVRNQNVWESAGYKLGTYWDSYAHPSQSGVHAEIKTRNIQGRHLTQVIEGETAYNWGNDTWDPKFGTSPTLTCNNYIYTNNLIDAIKDLHCTGLGWIASYKADGSEGTNIDTVKANAARIQEAFGYNFVIPEFSCQKRADQGSTLKIKFKVKNSGSAPFYENWPLAFVLIDETTQNIVWKEQLKSVDIRNWHSGANYSYLTKQYATVAKEYLIDTTITVPSTLLTGNYMAAVSILEPYSQNPGIFFDIKNFLTKSQTQPLVRIGIGQDLVGSSDVSPTLFGDPVTNDARTYSLTPQGLSYTLTTSGTNGTNGSISIYPAGGKYLPGTRVTVVLKTNLGYKFSEWNGDLSGTEKTMSIIMDGNKSITANIVTTPTYTLTATTNKGTISLNPAGGRYNADQVVYATPIKVFGFKFDSWSGDVTGNAVPAKIIMDTNKNIVATYTAIPIYKITGSATNGIIELNPVGPNYEMGTVVTANAKKDYGYQFKGWSGDTVSNKNPISLVMNADKNITANFFFNGDGKIAFATNCGGSSFRSAEGVAYTADNKFSGGSAYTTTNNITGTTDITPFQTNRFGTSFNYKILLPNKDYKVTLMFAEIYYSTANTRVFDVAIEGVKVSPALDVFAKVGKNVAYSETHNVTLTDGELNIDLSTIKGNANISAIKVVEVDYTPSYKLEMITSNGSISPNPPGGLYKEGTEVILTAIPNFRFAFQNWGYDITGKINPDTIVMNSNKKVLAVFKVATGIENPTNSSEETHVKQNFPNPFQNGTTIPYYLAEASHVKLLIYNSLGQQVATLVNEFKTAGSHKIFWNTQSNLGQSVRNGLYQYRLETKNKVVSGSMLLINNN